MSRSIHKTRSRQYRRQHGYSEFEDGYDWEYIDALLEKSRIKRFARSDRESSAPPFVPVSADQIAYSIEDVRRPLFFPASLADVKAVINELPPGFLNGVAGVKFLSGHKYINEMPSIDGEVRDPAGRKCMEIRPGIYAPIVLGSYNTGSGIVEMFAYALDEMVELSETDTIALKIKMLLTLIHELCHNYDKVMRVARGRWRLDSEAKAEAYAEKMTDVFLYSVVIPYLRREHGPTAG